MTSYKGSMKTCKKMGWGGDKRNEGARAGAILVYGMMKERMIKREEKDRECGHNISQLIYPVTLLPRQKTPQSKRTSKQTVGDPAPTVMMTGLGLAAS